MRLFCREFVEFFFLELTELTRNIGRLIRVQPIQAESRYLVADSSRSASRWTRLGRVVLDSADFLNPGVQSVWLWCVLLQMHILAIFVIWYDKDLNIWVFSRQTGHWPYGLHRILHEKNPLEHQGSHSPSPCTQPRMPPARILAIFPIGCWCTHPTCASPPSLSSISRTSRSSWMWESKSSKIWLRLLADHRRVTVPMNIDQKVRSRIATNAQNLY